MYLLPLYCSECVYSFLIITKFQLLHSTGCKTRHNCCHNTSPYEACEVQDQGVVLSVFKIMRKLWICTGDRGNDPEYWKQLWFLSSSKWFKTWALNKFLKICYRLIYCFAKPSYFEQTNGLHLFRATHYNGFLLSTFHGAK